MPSPSLARTRPSEQSAATPAPLALTDAELNQIMRYAGPLHPRLRRAFVERVAYELRGRVIGDGLVHRACAKVLKESGLFDAPLETEPNGLGHGPRQRERERGGVT